MPIDCLQQSHADDFKIRWQKELFSIVHRLLLIIVWSFFPRILRWMRADMIRRKSLGINDRSIPDELFRVFLRVLMVHVGIGAISVPRPLLYLVVFCVIYFSIVFVLFNFIE